MLGYQSQGDDITTIKQRHEEVQINFHEMKMQFEHWRYNLLIIKSHQKFVPELYRTVLNISFRENGSRFSHDFFSKTYVLSFSLGTCLPISQAYNRHRMCLQFHDQNWRWKISIQYAYLSSVHSFYFHVISFELVGETQSISTLLSSRPFQLLWLGPCYFQKTHKVSFKHSFQD